GPRSCRRSRRSTCRAHLAGRSRSATWDACATQRPLLDRTHGRDRPRRRVVLAAVRRSRARNITRGAGCRLVLHAPRHGARAAMNRVAGGSMVHERADSQVSLDQGRAASRTKWIIPLGVTALYLAWALAVQLRMLDSLDMAVRRATRTGVVWGPD